MSNDKYLPIDAKHIPTEEPERQYFFMDLLRDELTARKEEEHREFTMHVETFGCQMNAKDSEKLAGILTYIGYTPIEKIGRASCRERV